ncbi:MAG TPA: aminotransferase class V-fold PLP-dependent enzyme [Mycobacteriales bacterium]|nr:aminotransferase class V-fold PLP-dependent enzyme [Mycobacteriales bacterium]
MSEAEEPAWPAPVAFPQHGTGKDELLAALVANRHDDADWRAGRLFSLIYHPDHPALEDALAAVFREYLAENALNPFRFPSLARLERETADMVADLLHGTPGTGGLTAGGTESILVAVYVARELARERGNFHPVIVTGMTAHPAFAKACHLLAVEQVRVAVGPDHRIDLDALAGAVDDRTAMVVASAPNYPFGVIDPVEQVAALAGERGVLCHVDACLGGLLLPFWERLGEPVPPWDFRVPGVTSISADIHKYGYSYKGASVLLHRDPANYAKQWWFDDGAWGGGLYGSPTPAGTRPAPPIAGAWAALRFLGADGYLDLARIVRDTRDLLLRGIEQIDGLHVTQQPDLSIFEVGSDELDISAVADALIEAGWYPDRQPGGLHFMLSPFHAKVVPDLLAALAAAVAAVRGGRTSDGAAATYGSAGPSKAQP